MSFRLFLLLFLLFLSCGLCFGQADYSVQTLTAVGSLPCPFQNDSSHAVIYAVGYGSATFTIGTGSSGTIGFYASGDGGQTWLPLNVTPSNSTTAVSTANTVGLWQANIAGYTHVCMLMTAGTSVFAKIHTSSIAARAGGGGGGGGGMVPTGSTGIVSGLFTTNNTSGPATYNSATGALNIPNYLGMVPTGSTGISMLTTTGTGAATYSGGTGILNIPTPPAPPGPPPLSSITAATASNSIFNASFAQNWFFQSNFGGFPNGMFNILENPASTGGGTALANGSDSPILTAQTLAGSTATPFSVYQGTITNASNTTPVSQFYTTWNNAALVGTGLLLSVTNTASAATSRLLNLYSGVNGNTSVFSVDPGGSTTTTGTLTTGGGISVGGGGPVTLSTATTTALVSAWGFRGATTTGASYQMSTTTGLGIFSGGIDGTSFNGALGSGIYKGGDNSGTAANTLAAGGAAILRGGFLTGASTGTTNEEGVTEVVSGYRVGTIAALNDVVCGTTTQYVVSDCGTGPQVNIIGVATGNTGTTVSVVAYGTVPVRLSAAMTNIGDTVCLSTTTAGQAVDSGGQANCATPGAQLGVIIANSGNIVQANNTSVNTVTLSTTLPLVQLHIR